jgi:Inhibitor of Apoptosis domain/Zinc finger, C3HC4 type (RING finger)
MGRDVGNDAITSPTSLSLSSTLPAVRLVSAAAMLPAPPGYDIITDNDGITRDNDHFRPTPQRRRTTDRQAANLVDEIPERLSSQNEQLNVASPPIRGSSLSSLSSSSISSSSSTDVSIVTTSTTTTTIVSTTALALRVYGLFVHSEAKFSYYSTTYLRHRSFYLNDQHSMPTRYATGIVGGIDIRALAAAGLFYRHATNTVQCFHCGVLLNHWDSSDDPWDKHRKAQKDCYFLDLYSKQRYSSYLSGLAGTFDSDCSSPNPQPSASAINAVASDSLVAGSCQASSIIDNNSVATEVQPQPPPNPPSSSTRNMCTLCLDGPVEVCVMPCGHIAFCCDCTFRVGKRCPICMVPIKLTSRAFLV